MAVACSVYSAKLMPAWTGEGPRGEGDPAGRGQGYPPMCLELANTLHGVAMGLRTRTLLHTESQGTHGHTMQRLSAAVGRGNASWGAGVMGCRSDATLHC